MRIPVVSTLWKASIYWGQDRASLLGAGLAYHALFSIAPLLIIAIAVAGFFYGEAEVKHKILLLAKENIGQDGADAIRNLVEKFWQPQTTILATIIGPIVLFYAACNFFFQLSTALSIIWNLPEVPHHGWVRTLLITYGFAFAMVLMCGCFLFIIVASDAMLTRLINQVQDQLPGGKELWYWGHLALYLVLTMLMIMLTFRFLSNRRISYQKLWFGSLVAAILTILGRLLFGWYVSYMGKSLATAFGAASSVVIFLIWVYYTTQILLFGAEVIKVKLEPKQQQPAKLGA